MLAMGSDDFGDNTFTLKSYHLVGIGVASCSCSSVSQDAPCPVPSRIALIPVDASPHLLILVLIAPHNCQVVHVQNAHWGSASISTDRAVSFSCCRLKQSSPVHLHLDRSRKRLRKGLEVSFDRRAGSGRLPTCTYGPRITCEPLCNKSIRCRIIVGSAARCQNSLRITSWASPTLALEKKGPNQVMAPVLTMAIGTHTTI
jgi:hypothetical protein